jgi:DNA repair photolyase
MSAPRPPAPPRPQNVTSRAIPGETGPVRGRGAPDNPLGRFERLAVVPEPSEEAWRPDDAEAGGGPPRLPTELLRDTSRSIIARNDSPDIPFDVSFNPYRGCEHGCVYCLGGDTPILMADGTARPMRDVRAGDAIYGTRRDGWYRRYVRTRVLAHWETSKPAYEVTLADGTRLVASGDHRFLTDRGWKFVTGAQHGARRRPHLTERNKMLGTGRFATAPVGDEAAYRRGYLCGMIRGDGHLASYEYSRVGRSHGNQHQFRLALADHEALDRTRDYLAGFGVTVREFTFRAAAGRFRRMDAIRTSARDAIAAIRGLVAWPLEPSGDWQRGYLAGIYDAEGSAGGGILRISNTDAQIIEQIVRALRALGFSFAVERCRSDRDRPIQVVRLTGGLAAHLRLWHSIGNAISRKRDIEGAALKSSARVEVRAVEPLGEQIPLYDVTTGTGDFIADGIVSHNCYARPTHEYLGFSAGLDFETRILVKDDAPELLRRELTKSSWVPQTLALSGVTDPYQPVERRLRVTRRCLEVLAELRHPVSVITKNRLVTRDLDLLGELARHGAASVNLSVTTLDGDLAARMEPRASHPRERLRAISEAAAAGVPVGVMVAPVVPGLTDHEIPAILEAAAAAGATGAGWVPLRLPGAVAGLFERWLEEHFPERKEKVLSRVSSLRGGRLNDPRFGSRMRGEGVWAEQIATLFAGARRRHGLDGPRPALSTAAFRRPGEQLGLFGG